MQSPNNALRSMRFPTAKIPVASRSYLTTAADKEPYVCAQQLLAYRKIRSIRRMEYISEILNSCSN